MDDRHTPLTYATPRSPRRRAWWELAAAILVWSLIAAALAWAAWVIVEGGPTP